MDDDWRDYAGDGDGRDSETEEMNTFDPKAQAWFRLMELGLDTDQMLKAMELIKQGYIIVSFTLPLTQAVTYVAAKPEYACHKLFHEVVIF